jgi:phosphatidate cytidylyltransferase
MILLALAGAWADGWLDGVGIGDGTRTLPPGMVLTPAAVLVAIFAARELAGLLRGAGILASSFLTCVVAVLGLLVSAFVPSWFTGVSGGAVVSLSVASVLAFSMVYYGRHKNTDGMIAAAGGALLAFCLLGLMLGYIVTLRREQDIWVVIWVLLTTKSSDIGAYTLGHLIGRHKLIPWLSPGKTWEGLLGAVLFAAGIGAGGAALLGVFGIDGRPRAGPAALLGALFAIAGQAGDLLESVLKRDAGKKDSGETIPGFGGVLDVVDSLLLAPPIAYWLLPLAVVS